MFPLLAFETLSHVRFHEPRRDGVDVHAQPTNFTGEGSGKPDQRGLRGGVNREATVPRETHDRRDVHDPATPVGHHVADDIFGQDNR